MFSSELCREFVYGTEIECIASCPRSELLALGTRDGHLRCNNWISEDSIFEYNMPANAIPTTLQFGTDEQWFVCCSDQEKATS